MTVRYLEIKAQSMEVFKVLFITLIINKKNGGIKP